MSYLCNTLVEDLKPTTKLLNLGFKERYKLCAILQLDNSWLELARVIRNPDHTDQLLFKSDDISALNSGPRRGRNPAEILLERWSTSGQNQPDLNVLIIYLKEANLLRAANFVESQLLKISDDIPEKDLALEELETIIKGGQKYNMVPMVDSIDEKVHEIHLNKLTIFPFEVLCEATMRFCDLRAEKGGCKIGEGNYGAVFRACVSNKMVAVKKLKADVYKQFFTELSILVRCKHENLLPLLGCSFNGATCCLVYDYMENGSLQERLACSGNTPPLSSATRMAIAHGSALGINHLHTFDKTPMVHRDVKSANILLDANFRPKVGDFGLVMIGDNMSSTVAVGTRFYMAREAFDGVKDVKVDTFSFGVVLLELLTGLPPYDVNREDRDLITFMENYDDISTLLDRKVTWKRNDAVELYRIANFCLTDIMKERPTITEILPDLQKCCLHYRGVTR